MTRKSVPRPALSRRLSGFTLAEMAIVTLLIGIALTLGVGMLKAQMDNAATSSTQKKQEVIRNALVAFLRNNNWRLPCPDTNFDGKEDPAGGGPCPAYFGVLPYITLGLPREMVMDGWGNYMSYRVDGPIWTTTAAFNPGSLGTLTVNSDASPPPLTSSAVAVIISHGKNGSGAYTLTGSQNSIVGLGVNEKSNTTFAGPYFKREYTDSLLAPGGTFDDIVMFVQAEDLLTPLRNDGTLKAQIDALAVMANTVVMNSFVTCTLPAAFIPAGQVYGSTVTYTQSFAGAISLGTTAPGTQLFTLTIGGEPPTPYTLAQVSPLYVSARKCPTY
jgi:type II secretory pathway pseudopilin PulG